MSVATPEQIQVWADGLLARQAWVLHVATLAVGPVKQFFDGTTTKYRSSIDDQEVPAPVLELTTGHALLARDPTGFVELSAHDLRFYMAMQIGLRGICELSAKNAVATGVSLDKAQKLLVAALQAQLIAVQPPGGDVA